MYLVKTKESIHILSIHLNISLLACLLYLPNIKFSFLSVQSNSDNIEEVYEGEEKKTFWKTLGGKEEYASGKLLEVYQGQHMLAQS